MIHSSINFLHQQAILALNNNELETAHEYLVQVINKQNNHADAYFLLAMVNVKVGQITKAIKLIEKALTFSNEIEYKAHLAKCYALIGELNKARDCVENINPADIDNPITSDTIGVALSRVGLHTQAIQFFIQTLTLDKKNAGYHYNYGISCKFIGDFAQAKKAFEQSIEIEPLHVESHYALTDVTKITNENNHIDRLLRLQKKINTPDDKLHIAHALGREYEAIGQFDRAIECLKQSKLAKKSQINYHFSQDMKMFEVLQDLIKNRKFARCNGYDDDSAIFIVGMPRTGTTIIERILTQAPNVHSLGELQDFALLTKQLSKDSSNKILNDNVLNNLDNIDFSLLGNTYIQKAKTLSNGSDKFVDKMPLNILYAQLILTALPKAKIICLNRSPLDTIMSNFKQLFATNYSFYHYSLDLKDIYAFYKQFKILVEQYVQTYPQNFMIVNYEELVEEPEKIGKAIYVFCELAWCSGFDLIENNQTPVDTASAVQVRNPIVNSNVGNWRKYQSHLQEVIALLKNDGYIID